MIAEPERPAKPLPRIEGADKPFWDGLRAREVRVQKCLSCGRLRFPASRSCPKCHGDQSEWISVEPNGEVETFCVFHKAYFPGFATEMPYAVIQVRLDSGVRFFSNMVGIPREDIRIGMRVAGVFDDVAAGVTLLKFKPEE